MWVAATVTATATAAVDKLQWNAILVTHKK